MFKTGQLYAPAKNQNFPFALWILFWVNSNSDLTFLALSNIL